jgi:hypothetical protein
MSDYPVRFSVDYPDRPLNRLTTGFRVFTAIPIAIVLGLLQRTVLVFPVILMLVFRQKYPRWWYDWNLELSRFQNRFAAYSLLMDDRYPSTDDHQAVRLEYPEVSGPELNRWLPLVKWFLAIPHYVVLLFLWLATIFVVIFVWFAILFTGRYPRGAFEFVEGVMRWSTRVGGYAFDLVTDAYPPFTLSA